MKNYLILATVLLVVIFLFRGRKTGLASGTKECPKGTVRRILEGNPMGKAICVLDAEKVMSGPYNALPIIPPTAEDLERLKLWMQRR